MIVYLFLLTDTTGFTFRFYGDGWIGKYYGKAARIEDSTRYNMDISVQLSVNIYETNRVKFYILYRDDLDMAQQVGNIVFDPYLSHYWGTIGMKCFFTEQKLYANLYFTHDCIHIIDRPLDSLVAAGIKVVFNRFKIRVGTIYDLYKKRKTIGKGFYPLFSSEFGFYPQSKIIDYLNTKGFYHYDIALFPGLIWSPVEYLSLSFYFNLFLTNLTREEDNIRFAFDYTFEFMKGTKFGYFKIFFKDFIYNTDPIKSPQGKKMVGVGFGF